ncbi:hypothetical protein [Klebsiella michiganensis]|uniref:hypothetical protein n=1 Tax=Klebsiella michiganensis TaxID=1134687 RepID=UPI0023A95EE5|nr:hypothetical protein [Klebsiella michiganensis]MDD9638915.1 hypothetical protein [Klebsiella michiganensis]
MTKSTITREQAQQIIDAADEVITALAGTNDEVHKDDTGKMVRLWDDLNDRYAPPEVVRELARMALSAMDSEPVAWGNGCDKTVPAALRYLAENERPFGGESRFNAAHLYQLAREIESMSKVSFYRHAQQPVVDADDNFYSWFGREWAENYQYNQYTTAAKQMLGVMAESAWIAATERQRQKQSVSVPDVKIYEDVPYGVGRFKTHRDCYCDGWNACRAAMLNHPSSIQPNTDAATGTEIKHPSSNSPAIPEGYVMVPKEPTAQMYDAGDRQMTTKQVWDAMLAAAQQEEPDEK